MSLLFRLNLFLKILLIPTKACLGTFAVQRDLHGVTARISNRASD